MATRNRKLLVICPHPDDGEFGAHQLVVQAVKAGWDVHQLLMTCDEYGTDRPEFFGRRIAAIRRKEMEKAARAYDPSNPVKLHWAGYIDLHIPYKRSSIKKIVDFIDSLKPHIAAAPDPFLQFDYHPDHIKTGLIFYQALRFLKKNRRYIPPLCLFYYTTAPDFFLPLRYLEDVFRAASAHASQLPSSFFRAFMKIMPYIFGLINLPRTGRLCSGYRRVTFNDEVHIPRGILKLIDYAVRKASYPEIDMEKYGPHLWKIDSGPNTLPV